MASVRNNPYLSPLKYNQLYNSQSETSLSKKAASLSSGGASDSFASVPLPKQFIDLQGTLNRNETYIKDGEYNSHKLSTMGRTLSTIRSMVGDTQALLSSAISSPLVNQQEFTQLISDSLIRLESLLNETYNGASVFSGSLNCPSVDDLSALPDLLPNAGPDVSYYRGNFESLGFQADNNLEITIDTNAADACVEEFIRALRIAKTAILNSGQPIDQQRLSAANDLCLSSTSKLIEEESLLNIKQHDLSQSLETLREQNTGLSELIQRSGYRSFPEMIEDYYQEKATHEVSREVSLQMIRQLNDLVNRLNY